MNTDILIVGGGIVGMMATVALSPRYRVTVLDKSLQSRPDNRTTAFLKPSLDAMREWGIWGGNSNTQGQPLCKLRLIDAHNKEQHETVTFEDADGTPFGYNICNTALKKDLESRCDVRFGTSIQRIIQRDDSVHAILNDGTFCKAKLIIVADGKYSATRDLIGITARTQTMGQTALSFPVSHPDHAHQGISSEIYHQNMSCTLVPMNDPHQSAIVWMMPSRDVVHATQDIDKSVTKASGSVLGNLMALGQPAQWPVVSVLARKFMSERCVLIGEAAHSMPPIGAQGLNTSVRDIITLDECLRRVTDPGDRQALTAYERKRRLDVTLRVNGVNTYNILTKTTRVSPAIRRTAFRSLDRFDFLQRPLIQMGQT